MDVLYVRQKMKLIPITQDSPSVEEESSSDPIVQEVIKGTRQMYSDAPLELPWVGYLAILNNQWVGTCAFKSQPQANRVEIAYFTFPRFEGKGIATRMAELLVAIAEDSSPAVTITAQTMPMENASTRVLHKLGFTKTGDFTHPEDGLVWQWVRRTEAEQAASSNP